MPDEDELEEYFVTKLRRGGTHIMGRATYQSMAEYWPKSTELVAPAMNDIPKGRLLQDPADCRLGRFADGQR
jgi:dihydrofolate reductase